MEKIKAHYPLADIKAAFADKGNVQNITGSALKGARALGFSDEDIVEVIKQLTNKHLYKSMTTFHDHKIWQDVYHLRYRKIELYVKFSNDENGKYWLVSFKER
jgi:motility quorum-sensing regulator/GCU-specific mRNA interferase toxin